MGCFGSAVGHQSWATIRDQNNSRGNVANLYPDYENIFHICHNHHDHKSSDELDFIPAKQNELCVFNINVLQYFLNDSSINYHVRLCRVSYSIFSVFLFLFSWIIRPSQTPYATTSYNPQTSTTRITRHATQQHLIRLFSFTFLFLFLFLLYDLKISFSATISRQHTARYRHDIDIMSSNKDVAMLAKLHSTCQALASMQQ